MINLALYYKYIVRPQFLLKFPQKKYLEFLSYYLLKKVRLNIFLLDIKQNYYLYLYNICILIRLIFNQHLFIKKSKKKVIL